MAYASLERFRDITGRNVLALQQAKEAGKKVVGQYCIYSPLEIALAAGAIPVSLCGTKNDSIPSIATMHFHHSISTIILHLLPLREYIFIIFSRFFPESRIKSHLNQRHRMVDTCA